MILCGLLVPVRILDCFDSTRRAQEKPNPNPNFYLGASCLYRYLVSRQSETHRKRFVLKSQVALAGQSLIDSTIIKAADPRFIDLFAYCIESTRNESFNRYLQSQFPSIVYDQQTKECRDRCSSQGPSHSTREYT